MVLLIMFKLTVHDNAQSSAMFSIYCQFINFQRFTPTNFIAIIIYVYCHLESATRYAEHKYCRTEDCINTTKSCLACRHRKINNVGPFVVSDHNNNIARHNYVIIMQMRWLGEFVLLSTNAQIAMSIAAHLNSNLYT